MRERSYLRKIVGLISYRESEIFNSTKRSGHFETRSNYIILQNFEGQTQCFHFVRIESNGMSFERFVKKIDFKIFNNFVIKVGVILTH